MGPLYAALLVNGVQMIATIVTVFVVDKFGRRSMLLTASCVGFGADIAVAILFACTVKAGSPSLAFGPSIASIVLVSLQLFAYAHETPQ